MFETWESEAATASDWAIVRLEGIPTPDVEVYGVLARTGVPAPAAPSWVELALPGDSVWDERVVARDS